MRRQPRQKRSKAMVDTILEAGFLSLRKNGVQGTTTRHIADLAGISVGTLYQYFDDKEAVYAAMQARLIADLVLFLRELTPKLVQQEIREAIGLLLYGFRDWMQKDDGRYLVFARSAIQIGFDGEIERLEQALMDLVAQYMMQNPAFVRAENLPGVIYILINGGVFAMIRFLSTPQPRITFEQFVDAVATLLVGSTKVAKEAGKGTRRTRTTALRPARS